MMSMYSCLSCGTIAKLCYDKVNMTRNISQKWFSLKYVLSPKIGVFTPIYTPMLIKQHGHAHQANLRRKLTW